MVMHARKPQRMSDGYFEKHQAHPYQSSKYSSKRDYERDAGNRSTGYLRGNERDNSPNSSGPIITINNGNNSYRSDSNELDSPRDSRSDRDRYQNSSYIQKMKDRGRSDYKKDKYTTDKRDRRAEHRTNHDRIDLSASRRSSKLYNMSSSTSEKRSGSIERERTDRSERSDRGEFRERDRDRDRDRDRERNDRDKLNRFGDWSEHVSSSGKKYYYNCKTEVSQWEKPKEWLDKERIITKEPHRDYRDKERDKDREDRFSRSSAYVKHSSRSTSRVRWPPETEGAYGNRRRNEDNPDMDISPGDSTPTSEASYSHSSTPTTQQPNHDGPVLLSNVLPRLACHPSTPTNSQLHFTTSSVSGINSTSTCTVSSSSGISNIVGMGVGGGGNSCGGIGNNNNSGNSVNVSCTGNALSKAPTIKSSSDTCNSSNLPTSSPSTIALGPMSTSSNAPSLSGVGGGIGSHNATSSELLMNSNAPGPPIPVTLSNLPKILSKITGNKQIDHTELNPQKALQQINNALLLSSRQQTTGGADADNSNQIANNNSNNLREHVLNSPLYNYSHNMQQQQQPVSIYNHTGNSQYVTSTAGVLSTQTTGMGISMQFSAAGLKADGSSTLNRGDGPPTPTQELDMSCDHRKLDGTSASLSCLQGVVATSQVLRNQGPSLTPSLANYVRADLIAHVMNWPAEMLEKQAQITSDEAIIIGDLQCTKVSADLKSARSVVRITEITATLQEQKVMYLRQQIRRLEELKSQNSFMSDEPPNTYT